MHHNDEAALRDLTGRANEALAHRFGHEVGPLSVAARVEAPSGLSETLLVYLQGPAESLAEAQIILTAALAEHRLGFDLGPV